MWDCVDRVASRAYERGIEILVDEDLTEFFPSFIGPNSLHPDFKVDEYPSHNILAGLREDQKEWMMKPRIKRPWCWQEY